ncbi:hypothetical protein MPTK1_2g07860 [Marchantia polymorpha subsp. ruderalis]|uniref:CR-type domain-containing protein n=2 Tax=Marchantia polymorpha TaxID=3197 RepID=A0A176WHB8_MARPO|nr:hypothetical protein AXG93_3384s1690 [Marchantia polymorpha subsp. ruderalis]PTQ45265.1 hypothetical protein MARPO_0015s0072 [Marchantia polymorpha]BBN01497.1 hypothetical protein Mp_2g07860 [Marchantia polymorpha subsp. ruderalis]|eukprot:PTQ45265.1 hypothetical protein MARPO_0015s0072 [Marchantia polymorpha]
MSITESEIAGFGVGALLLAASIAAPRIDAFIARAQRRSLRLCEECGGVQRLPCKKCRGRGQERVAFSSPWAKSEAAPACGACNGRGQIPCSSCSKL